MTVKVERETVRKQISNLPDDAIQNAIGCVMQAERYLKESKFHSGNSRAIHLASAIGWMTMARDRIDRAIMDTI